MCECVSQLLSRIRDDWICQPAGTLITSPIFRLTRHNRSHLRERGIWARPFRKPPLQIQDRASDSDLFSRKGVNGISRTIQTESRAWIQVPSLLAALLKKWFKQLERWRIINALKWIVTAGCKVFGLSGNFKQTWHNETDRILINKPHF